MYVRGQGHCWYYYIQMYARAKVIADITTYKRMSEVKVIGGIVTYECMSGVKVLASITTCIYYYALVKIL